MKKKIWIIVLASVAAIALIVTAVIALSSGETKNSWQEQYDLGVRYLNEGNYEEAIIAFTAAIEIDPRNPGLYIGRANAYTEMGDITSARVDYETALEIDDTLTDAWIGLAETYAAEGNIEKALEILQDAATKTSDPRIKTKIEELESKLAPSHVHTWLDATCTEPKTCSECGETEGVALGHDMLPATVDAPSTCSRCGYTEGEPLRSNITWTLENGTLTISGSGPMKNYYWYYGDSAPWSDRRYEIERVVIENGITRIGASAFDNCTKLTNIEIPESVTEIGEMAFITCDSLTVIEIPNSVTTIGNRAFSLCPRLSNVEIPNSVTTIGEGAFADCDSLQRISVGAGNLNYISVNGVLYNRDMTLLHTYPAGKTETSYAIPDSVTTIGAEAFDGCMKLRSIEIPNGVTTIGNQAFNACVSLMGIEIPDSVTAIGNRAFNSCVRFVSIEIPGSVMTVGDSAFSNCYALISIVIPISVTTIGNYVLSHCNNVTDIYYGGTAEQWAAIAADADVPETATVHYNYSE